MPLDPSKSPQAAWTAKKRRTNYARIVLAIALIPAALIAFPLLVHLVLFGGKQLYVDELLFFVACDALLVVLVILFWIMPPPKLNS